MHWLRFDDKADGPWRSGSRRLTLCRSALFLGMVLGAIFSGNLVLGQVGEEGGVGDDPQDTKNKLMELEQLGPPKPAERPAEKKPKEEEMQEKTRELIDKLEERATEEREQKSEELTPKERAKKRMRSLEAEEELKAAEQKLEAKELQGEGAALKTRTQLFLRLFGPLVRIYDEILTQTGKIGMYYDDLFDRTKDAPNLLYEAVGKPKGVVLGGQYRIRYETLNGRFRLGEAGSDQQLAHQTQIHFGIKDIFDPFRATVELQDARVNLNDGGSFVNHTHVNKTDILQLRLDLVTDSFLGSDLHTELNVGRMTIDLGRRRWVARNVFRNTTNAFDGVNWLIGRHKRWQLQSFLFQPVRRFHERLDPIGEIQGSTLWGLYWTMGGEGRVHTDMYYLGHRSRGPNRDVDMLGFRVYTEPRQGEFHYEVESSYQFGDTSLGGRFEHFQHGEIGYTFDLPWVLSPVAKFDYASPGIDTLYGARAFELHPTGIFGPVFRTNMISPGVQLLVRPKENLSLFVQHRAFWLADGREPWRGTGLVDPTGASGTFLGHSIDLRVGVDIFHNLLLRGGVVQFYFDGFARTVPGGPGAPRADYGYVFTTFLF
jgi:hypothetical protein